MFDEQMNTEQGSLTGSSHFVGQVEADNKNKPPRLMTSAQTCTETDYILVLCI